VESGINWIDTAAVYGLGHSEEVAPASIRTEVEASLRRLRTERIDLYQIGRPRTAHRWRNTGRSSRRRVTVWRLAAVPDFLLASSRYGGLP
jgi:aryl-alcohol dehydrogenase-like predicted oxidoreductase